MKNLFSCLVLLAVFSSAAFCQDSEIKSNIIASGLTIELGFGHFAITDEYISKEKYSGNLPYFKAGWSNVHETYIYTLDFEFRNANDIENYNVTTEIIQLTLNNGFLYPLSAQKLWGRDLHIFIGPAMEIFILSNDQNIAVSGFDYAVSFAGLISAGLNSAALYPLTEKWQVESTLRFSVLSLGLRMVDSEEDDASPGKLLTLLAGTNVNFRLSMRYKLAESFSLTAGYGLNITRISSWEPLLSASDNLILGIHYGF